MPIGGVNESHKIFSPRNETLNRSVSKIVFSDSAQKKMLKIHTLFLSAVDYNICKSENKSFFQNKKIPTNFFVERIFFYSVQSEKNFFAKDFIGVNSKHLKNFDWLERA